MKHRLTSLVWLGGFLSVWTATAADPRLSIELGTSNSLELLLVQPGTFSMGSPATEEGRSEDEQVRSTTLTQAFYLGRTEVTVRQFEAFVRETRYRTEAEDGKSGGFGWDGTKLVQAPRYTWRAPGYLQTPDHPVTLVTWNDAKRFCAWLSGKAKRVITLPSEAQWEYACRAGATSAWSGGPVEEVAWTVENAAGQAHPVGSRKANAWGFHDLHGNVWEWCEDWYGPYQPAQLLDPLQVRSDLSDKPRRVLRGGSWLKETRFSRSAARYRNDPRSRNPDNGFRVMSPATESAPAAPSGANPAAVPNPDATKGNTALPNPAPNPSSGESSVRGEAAPSAATPVPSSRQRARIAEAAPGSHAASPMVQPTEPRMGIRWSHLIPWGVFGFIGMILIALVGKAILSGARSGSGSDSMASVISESTGAVPVSGRARLFEISPQSDGFWILARVPAGSHMQWSCLAAGRVLEGELDYQPGPQGQFIFTGSTPSEIKVRTVGSGGPLDGTSNDPGVMPTTDDPNLLGRAAMLYEINDSMRRARESSNPSTTARRRRNPSAY